LVKQREKNTGRLTERKVQLADRKLRSRKAQKRQAREQCCLLKYDKIFQTAGDRK